MEKMEEIEYTFVSTMPMERERIEMGWGLNDEFSFELKAYESEENLKKAKQIALESDIVIIGSASDEFIIPRLNKNKVTFKYSERPYKNGITLNNFIRVIGGTWLHHGRFQKKELYMLCASSYTASDFAKLGCYKNKCFRWGYFPESLEYNIADLFKKKENKKLKLLWVGRLIKWKHPDVVLKIAQKLKEQGYQFQLNLIGDGEMRTELEEMRKKLDVSDCVSFLGNMPAFEVRKHMEQANIFMFTSDKREGWGAVLNESMNSACAVVANSEIGSVGFLIQDGVNGLIYHGGNEEELFNKVLTLVGDEALRKQLGQNAYHSIMDLWSAKVAATRLVKLCDLILKQDNPDRFAEGPCSKI